MAAAQTLSALRAWAQSAPRGAAEIMCLDVGRVKTGVAVTIGNRLAAVPVALQVSAPDGSTRWDDGPRRFRSDWERQQAGRRRNRGKQLPNVDILALHRLFDEHNCGALVVGLPLQLDGREGKQCAYVRGYAARLTQIEPMSRLSRAPMLFWDERFSTGATTELLEWQQGKPTRGQTPVDPLVAVFLLDSVLESLGSEG